MMVVVLEVVMMPVVMVVVVVELAVSSGDGCIGRGSGVA